MTHELTISGAELLRARGLHPPPRLADPIQLVPHQSGPPVPLVMAAKKDQLNASKWKTTRGSLDT